MQRESIRTAETRRRLGISDAVFETKGRSNLVTEAQEEIYTTKEVADIFKVRSDTIRKWIKQGELEAFKTPGGQVRVRASEVKRLAQSKYGGEDNHA